jgi:hypothetical protein
LASAVFVIGISCESVAAKAAQTANADYIAAATKELEYLAERLSKSGLCAKLKFVLVYVPLASKEDLIKSFDGRLKGIQ